MIKHEEQPVPSNNSAIYVGLFVISLVVCCVVVVYFYAGPESQPDVGVVSRQDPLKMKPEPEPEPEPEPGLTLEQQHEYDSINGPTAVIHDEDGFAIQSGGGESSEHTAITPV